MDELPRESRTAYVYLIGAADSRLVKIGRTTDIASRLVALQRMGPARLTILWQTKGGSQLEAALHRKLKDRRSHGEWFEFPDGDAPERVRDAIAELAAEAEEAERSRLEREVREAREAAVASRLLLEDGPVPDGGAFALGTREIVRILARDWKGPTVGVVHDRLVLRRTGASLYYVGDVGDSKSPRYAFKQNELRRGKGLIREISATWPAPDECPGRGYSRVGSVLHGGGSY
jgi:hypothetical protein